MAMVKVIGACWLCILACFANAQTRTKNQKAVFLEDISWTAARELLNPETVVIIPLGAAAKEHGPHLPLATDFIQAEHFKNAIALQRNVVIAPTFSYGFYPAFVKYPGSTTTYFSSSRDALLQVIRTLSGFGPRRFYIINIGVSTTPVLEAAASILRNEGILLYYSDYSRSNYENAETGIREKDAGGHADEMESSNVLFMRPDLVNMKKAVDDTTGYAQPGPLTPVPLPSGKHNVSGVIGFATLASADKGKKYSANFTRELIKEIDSISSCALPVAANNMEPYKKYLGMYADNKGRKLEIGFHKNQLYYIWNNGRDLKDFFPLFMDAADHFSSMYMDLLFVMNDNNVAEKVWCQFRGEGFWVKPIR